MVRGAIACGRTVRPAAGSARGSGSGDHPPESEGMNAVQWKSGEITGKLLSVALLAGSGFFFLQSGYIDEYIVPGVLFGAGGMLLALRRERRAELPAELQQRVDQLARGLSTTQAELASTQEELHRLLEANDFMTQLRTPAAPATLPSATPPPGDR